MKNIVLVFDRTREHPGLRDATNAETLFRLLDKDGQIVWYHTGTRTPLLARGVKAALRWREAAIADARAGIAEAYAYLIDTWEPGDRIFMFGVGPGAFCARELARLLGTIGLMQAHRGRPGGLRAGHLRAAPHPPDTAGLAAGYPAGGQAGRSA